MRNPVKVFALLIATVVFSSGALLVAAPPAQQPTVTRKILLKQDSPVAGYEEALVQVDMPVGAREGRHTHPGSAIIYVVQGTLTLEYEGKPTATYNPGDSTYVEAGKIHEGRNAGTTPVKILATFVLQKGQPMTTQVQ
jgi:quercetin dioxygenase-like cupin family protein